MKVKEVKEKVTPILIKHKIRKAGVFGSVAKNKDRKDSDVDLLIELGDDISLLEFIGIKLELEEALKKKVDLVEYKAIKPLLKDIILKEEVRIYG